MKYYIMVEENIVKTKGLAQEIEEDALEISEELYNSIEVPSTFELNSKSEMINIQFAPEILPKLEPSPNIIMEHIDEEKAALAEAVIFLSDKVDELKNKVNLLGGN